MERYMHEEQFVTKNREGKRLNAALRTPEPNKKMKSKGTFVLLHGLGGWKDQYLLVVVAESMRAQGYYVVTFDAADGAKGPDGDFSKGVTSGYLLDLEDMIAYIKKQPWYTVPLLLGAHSQGSLVALRYAREHQEDISKLILIASPLSWKVGLPWTLPFGIWWLITNKFMTPGPGPARTKLLLKRSWLLDFMKYDARKDASTVTIPTLVISGEKDETVGDTKTQKKIADALVQGTQVVIPTARHIFYRHEREVADAIRDWLEKSGGE